MESPHDGILLHGSVRSGQSIQSGDSLLVLHKPLNLRLREGLGALFRLDMGRSWSVPERTVWGQIGPSLGVSLGLGWVAWWIAMGIGLGWSILASRRTLQFWMGGIEALVLSMSTLVLAPAVLWVVGRGSTDPHTSWWLAAAVLGGYSGFPSPEW